MIVSTLRGNNMKNYAIETFQKYMGTGLIVIWFLIALIYLFLSEKRKPRRILFVYTPIIVLLFFFNPLFTKLFSLGAETEIYFRTCWLLPIIVVIAYSVVRITDRLKGKRAGFFAVISLLLIMASGRLVYTNPLYSRAENIYHMPDSIVHICDAIRVPGREVMAVFPEELLIYVRQYSPYVCMPYGREVFMEIFHALYIAMEKDPDSVNLAELVPLSREAGCHYVVLRENTKITGELSDYDWSIYLQTDGYIVYRDNGVELVIP